MQPTASVSAVEAYSGEEFGRLAGLLDRVSTDSREVRDSYRYALQCELDFFSDVIRSWSSVITET